jgi:voltage-gated potassium channel
MGEKKQVWDRSRKGTGEVVLEEWVARALGTEGSYESARYFRGVQSVVLALGLAAVVLGTEPSIAPRHGSLLLAISYAVLGLFALEYWVRLVYAPALLRAREELSPAMLRLIWVVSVGGIADLLAWLPFLIALVMAPHPFDAQIYGALWILKLGRLAPRIGLLGRVVRHARQPLLAVFSAFLTILLIAATLGYLLERTQQPQTFGSIPKSLWWAITTLTTTGYGDAVPVTTFGRIMGGAVMVCGIFLFALWAGILATEFAQEMRRQDFLRTWDLVAKVPYFKGASAAAIAEVVRLLKPAEAAAGAVVMRRGDPGDAMYFLVEGEVEIQIRPEPVILGPGSFFGEMALLTGAPRTATVVARRRCILLLLDIVHFRELAATRPELLSAISEEAERRGSQTRAMSSVG